MEVYILDSNLRRDSVVEGYHSMIWTERYSTWGDFQLDIDPSLAEKALLSQGTYLAIDKSDRVMYTDDVESSSEEDGSRILTVKGKSLEKILDERPNSYTAISSGGAPAQVTLGPGLPAVLLRAIVDSTLRTNANITDDNISFLQAGSYSPLGDIAEPSDSVTILTDVDTLYNTVKTICDTYHLGFRLIRIEDATPSNPAKLYFEVYTGFDRTTSQTANAAVVFSSELDNLTDTTELTTSAGFKNVAYVYGTNGSRVVYGDDNTVLGFNKKVLIVTASDITTVAGATLNAQLDQRGKEELAKNRVVVGFDGQISQSSKYVYGTNYKLGDLVEQRSEHGYTNKMRVTEQIFVSDKEGEKSYPTLVLDSLVVPGSWDAISASKKWDDYTTEVWDSM